MQEEDPDKSAGVLRFSPPLSTSAFEAVWACAASRCAEDLRDLARIKPYLDGQSHLEEIMFLEEMRRSRLIQILEKFQAVLVRVKHEDSHLSVFYQHVRAPS